MLIQFSVTNFRSIEKLQTLSLIASNNREEAKVDTLDSGIFAGKMGIKLLPAVAIYGANAAGKSNLLSAFREMATIVQKSASEKFRGEFISVTPFMLNPATRNAPSEFEACFIANGVRYQYGFAATKERVVEEWLLVYPNNRPQRWFNRVWDKKQKKYDWFLGSSLSGEKALWKKSTRDNALFLSTAVQLNSQQLQPVYDWFYNTVRFGGISGFTNQFSASLCETKQKQEVLNYLRAADMGIDDIQVKKMPVADIATFARKNTPKKFYDIQMVHRDASNNPVAFDIKDESHGTQKFFAFAGPWIDSLKSGYVLFIDELHNSLHPKVVEYLIRMFNQKKTNPNSAQLIFTTHESSVMDQKILRRDQVWFCEKVNQGTDVYPLTDFHPHKGRENLRSSYLSGGYGALPYIKEAHG